MQDIQTFSPSLPEEYCALLRDIWRLNRVHNGPDQLVAMRRTTEFINKNFRGDVQLDYFAANQECNWWRTPMRWTVKSFELVDPSGNVIADHLAHPLVVCPYSISVDKTIGLDELKEHVVSEPERPESYIFHFRRMYRHWEKGWSISLPHQLLQSLPEGAYKIRIDTEFAEEPMPFVEYNLVGRFESVICLVAHFDHPGMVNDSLSGCLALMQAVEELERAVGKPMFSYKVLLVAEHVGSALWLDSNAQQVDKIKFVLSANMTAHNAPLAMCLSKSANSMLDLAMHQSLKQHEESFLVGEFHRYPDCGDEIAFDTVGYDIPSTTISRTGEMFQEYHCSADNLELFLQPDWQERHQKTVRIIFNALLMLEQNVSIKPKFRGMPCLGHPDLDLYLDATNLNNIRRNCNALDSLDGSEIDGRAFMEYFLAALSNDGVSVLEIAAAAALPFSFVREYAQKFADKNLIKLSNCERSQAIDLPVKVALSRGGLV